MSIFNFLYRWLLTAIPIKPAPSSTLELRNLSGVSFSIISLLIVVSPPNPSIYHGHVTRTTDSENQQRLVVSFVIKVDLIIGTVFLSKTLYLLVKMQHRKP